MRLGSYIKECVVRLLEERRVVVWYDGERVFGGIVKEFLAPSCVVISAGESRLRARREADEAVRLLNDPAHPTRMNGTVLIHAPWPRGTTEESKLQDPFEAFALIGTAFGDKEGERFQSLARQAMPARAADIDRLFNEGQPTVPMIETLDEHVRYPLLAQAFGTESAQESAVLMLCQEGAPRQLAAVQGALGEFLRLLHTDIGFEVYSPEAAAGAVAEQLARFVLLSEFAFDVGALPDALSAVSHAAELHRQRIFALCDRMRTSDDTREAYVRVASRVESELRLRVLPGDAVSVGSRETFGFQERLRLARLQALATDGNLAEARQLTIQGRRSVWRSLPDRGVLWKLAERCLDFLQAAASVAGQPQAGDASVREWIEAYAAPDGLSQVDRHQRLVEQGATECNEDEEIGALVALCRRRYREVAGAAVTRFQKVVEREGWPPEGVTRQSQVFDRHVASAIAERRGVAYFLVDAMRYEMGRDLAQVLETLGSVGVTFAVVGLPSTTQCGMAALMPSADMSLTLVEDGDDLAPALGGRALRTSADRMNLLRERWGDRFRELPVSDLLSWQQRKLAAATGSADLVVVRSQEIDALGEGPSLYHARKYITGILGELRAATERLAGLGFTTFVYAADHGHVLLPEVAPGDVVAPPPGTWKQTKRRVRLGSSTASAPGVIVFPVEKLGIVAPVPEIAFTVAFRVFTSDPYFHEGLSLQESLIPVVTLLCRAPVEPTSATVEVEIRYRADHFTSRVVGLKIWYNALLGESLSVRVEAYDGSGPKAKRVGEAADCDARDPVTHLVRLEKGKETQVPLRVFEDFTGATLEVRALDPATPTIFHRLKLKNSVME
jgi:PglZ domain